MSECPDSQTISDYARNLLAPDETERVERHLTGCGGCMKGVLASKQDSSFPRLKSCHIVKELGSGRFGVVYKAWWLKGRPRLVALKCLSFAGEMERERFEREVTVLKQIDSPNIVKCLESGVAGGTSYYVMELITGAHLDEYLETSASSLHEKLAVFERVCAAVAEAHAQGVIHRDLKPKNILIDARGRPRILDFGICALEPDDWDSSVCHTITRPGDIIGTLKYMSPEQAWGGVGRPIDERTDVWALGVMLYEIVTNGEYPYDMGATADKPAHEALLERIRKEMPAVPRLRNIERGRHLEVLLERCLAWEPERRLASAGALADDIGRYLAGQRIKARPFSLPHRFHRLCVGIATKARAAALFALVASVALAIAVSTYAFDVRWLATDGDQAVVMLAPANDAPRGDRVLVAGVYDSTAPSVVDFARTKGIAGVGPDLRSWRAVHGLLMERLSSAGPAAVVWDYYFRQPQPADAAFVRGAQSLQASGIPVVLAAFAYTEEGEPDLSPAVRSGLGDRLHHGTIIARDMVELEGEFVLAIKRRDERVVPGLALATYAAISKPDARPDIEWRGRRKSFDILYETGPGAYMRTRDRVELTKVFSKTTSDLSVSAGDLLACRTFELRRPAYWQDRTVPYESLLTCPLDQLRDLVRGKVVIVGDLRESRPGFRSDRQVVRYGRTVLHDVPGVYLVGDAISGLLDNRYMESAFLPPPATLAFMLALAAAGCLIPLKLAARRVFDPQRNRHATCLGLAAFAIACFALMCVAESYRAVHLGMAGFSLLAPMCGSFWMEFSRNRHLILEKQRQTVESIQFEANRTLTMPRLRSKTLQAGR